MTVHNSVHNTKQNSSDNLPSYLQTNITAQMLSIRGEGDQEWISLGLQTWWRGWSHDLPFMGI